MKQYAEAAGLVERSAAAFVRGVPDQPADGGFFGPASVAWRISGDLSAPVAGLRALLVQALHPLAMAGVDQHSDWRADPVGRLAATSAYLAVTTFGERAGAERAAARVRRIHEQVRGVDPVTGQEYCASDPALLLWVHAALVDSTVVARNLFGSPLTADDADRYIEEMVVAAELVGVPAQLVPDSAAALERYLGRVRPQLQCTRAARQSTAYLLDPPGLDEEVAEIWQDIREAVLVSLPAWARDSYGYRAPDLTATRRDEIRQALGVLDAVFLGEPGVLEARQRITLRMRAHAGGSGGRPPGRAAAHG
ncbi:MAG: oxygenase MpaB family protein [Streptosporangiaceae bacterium]